MYQFPSMPDMVMITGDELDWEPGIVYDNGHVFEPFNLSSAEQALAKKTLAAAAPLPRAPKA